MKICKKCGQELKQTDIYQRDLTCNYWCCVCVDIVLSQYHDMQAVIEAAREVCKMCCGDNWKSNCQIHGRYCDYHNVGQALAALDKGGKDGIHD